MAARLGDFIVGIPTQYYLLLFSFPFLVLNLSARFLGSEWFDLNQLSHIDIGPSKKVHSKNFKMTTVSKWPSFQDFSEMASVISIKLHIDFTRRRTFKF